jgi:membrane-associated protease RseP (regulator of RpoE activity)
MTVRRGDDIQGETPMKREWLPRRLMQHVVLFGGCAAVLGLAVAFGGQAADAQKNPRKDAPKTAAPAPASGTQAAPAVPRREAKAENRDAKRTKRRAMTLGAQLQVQGNQGGLQVSNLEENSMAARAGLQANDRVIAVDGRAFASGRQLDAYLASQGGRRVPIIIERNGQRSTIFITPAAMDADTAWLGVYLEEGEAAGEQGARITHVYPSGPAARAGLHAGDVIVQIDDRKIEGPSDVITYVQESEPQAETQFAIMRNEQQMTVPVVLGSRQHFLPPAQNNGFGQQGNANHGPGNYGQQTNENDDFEHVPPHAMQLEHDRRIAEQHQRIEQELQALREEIRQLREELKKK